MNRWSFKSEIKKGFIAEAFFYMQLCCVRVIRPGCFPEVNEEIQGEY